MQQDDVKILIQDAMTSKSQVPQIPAKKPLPSNNYTASAMGPSAITTAASSNAQAPVCIMQPSAANQSLLKANPVGGASDAVSNIRSQVEAEGRLFKLFIIVMLSIHKRKGMRRNIQAHDTTICRFSLAHLM